MKAIIYGLAALLLAGVSCSKSSKTQKGEEIMVSEPMERSKAYQDSIFYLEKSKLKEFGTDEQYQNFILSQEDFFLRYEDRFSSMMINDVIPDDFPRDNSGIDEETYMGKVKNWMKENQDSLKPEFRD